MKYKQLDAEGIEREKKHIASIKLSISTLGKENTEMITDPEIYNAEIKIKIEAHERVIAGLKYDLTTSHTYNLKMEKFSKNEKSIERHMNNIKVHQKHIDEGIPDNTTMTQLDREPEERTDQTG